MSKTIWDAVLARIETKVNRFSYFSWFHRTRLLLDGGDQMTVQVPNPMAAEWLSRHYPALIEEALGEVGRRGVQLTYEAAEDDAQAGSGATPVSEPLPVPEGRDEPVVEPADDHAGLSPRYSFDTFIVGASNQFADAACRAVAEAPSRSYNPLFIYGGGGLGKNHLMHAIGHYVLNHHPGLKLT